MEEKESKISQKGWIQRQKEATYFSRITIIEAQSMHRGGSSRALMLIGTYY